MRGPFAWAGWGHAAAKGRSRCPRSRVGREGSHFFTPHFMASHLSNFKIQPGYKTQDNSSSTGQPAEPKAEAGVILNLLPDKASFKAATNLLRFGARAPPPQMEAPEFDPGDSLELKLTAPSRIWATVRKVQLQLQLQSRAGAAASPSRAEPPVQQPHCHVPRLTTPMPSKAKIAVPKNRG